MGQVLGDELAQASCCEWKSGARPSPQESRGMHGLERHRLGGGIRPRRQCLRRCWKTAGVERWIWTTRETAGWIRRNEVDATPSASQGSLAELPVWGPQSVRLSLRSWARRLQQWGRCRAYVLGRRSVPSGIRTNASRTSAPARQTFSKGERLQGARQYASERGTTRDSRGTRDKTRQTRLAGVQWASGRDARSPGVTRLGVGRRQAPRRLRTPPGHR